MDEPKTEMAPAGRRTEESHALCKRCGFCCDGTLFQTAPTAPGESIDPDFAARSRWVERDGQRHFRQPCVAFDGTCSVYSCRPHVCKTFRCKLLRRCEAGTETWENAHEIVRRARGHRDRVVAGVRAAAGASERPLALAEEIQRLHATKQPDESDVAFRRRHAVFLVAYTALAKYLEEHFLLPKAKPAAPPPAAGGD